MFVQAGTVYNTRALAYSYSRYYTSSDLRVLPLIPIYKWRPSCCSSSSVCNMSAQNAKHQNMSGYNDTDTQQQMSSYVRILGPYGGGNAIWGLDKPCCSYQPQHQQVASTTVLFLAIQRDVCPYISLDWI